MFWKKKKSSKPRFPPRPKWKPNLIVDINRIVSTFIFYSAEKNPFATFQNGTCVVFDQDSKIQSWMQNII